METPNLGIDEVIQSPESFLTPTKEETDLLTLPVLSQLEIESPTNKVYRADLAGGISGIFKTKEVFKELKQYIEPGTCKNRERASFIVDKAIGLNLVPTTVIRQINGETGSLQKFIPSYEWYDHQNINHLKHEKQILDLFLLDYIIWNSDRNRYNFFVNNDGLHAIDNGFSFSPDDLHIYEDLGSNSGINVYRNRDLPQETMEKIKKFSLDQTQKKTLEAELGKLLNPSETMACLHRVDFLAKIFRRNNKITNNISLPYDPN